MRKKPNYTVFQFILDVWHYISPYKGRFFVGVIIRLSSDISHLYPIWALSRVVVILSGKITDQTLHQLIVIFFLWGVTALYYSFSHNFSKYFGYQVAERASLDIYKECLAHIFKLDFAWQEKENSGNKMKRIDRGLDGVNVTIRRIFNTLIEAVVNIVGIVAVFFTIERLLSIGLVFYIVSYFVVGTILLKKAIRQEKVVSKSFENLGGLTFESLNNIQTIKSLSIDKGVVSLVSRYIRVLYRKIKKRIFYFQSQYGALLIYQTMFEFAVVAILARGILTGTNDIGLLVLFIGLFQQVSASTGELTDVVQQLALAKIWVSRAMEILKLEPQIEHPIKMKNQLSYNPDWKTLEINDINFSYKKSEALSRVSFTINRGQKVGIVGLSGAGKSTLFKLLLDLYETYKGEILLDGVPLKKIKRQSYIDHVAVVLQDTELFDMTLGENIEIASVGKITDSNLLKNVLTMAHLDEVVRNLPRGVNTVVGEKGIKLSGGQRQRVGIARALYRNPDILLLDEATSHLDAHSEKEIQNAILENMSKFTTIVIAHRLSTIKAMDKIIVLENGRVIEQGSFDELLANNGAFSKMWLDQKI